ncbi:hypothetical protein GUJ93_ZPchr0004g39985 [Zizania palustris]|uniref:Uncharacterized protein n=1 Tax=Zizania palustris TaxID=103762 RepID=A0A8J5SN85_ZIZPA|nr:hypothetical protein GUJ93_ZPchr0004g39985 [Zizania palustris]
MLHATAKESTAVAAQESTAAAAEKIYHRPPMPTRADLPLLPKRFDLHPTCQLPPLFPLFSFSSLCLSCASRAFSLPRVLLLAFSFPRSFYFHTRQLPDSLVLALGMLGVQPMPYRA